MGHLAVAESLKGMAGFREEKSEKMVLWSEWKASGAQVNCAVWSEMIGTGEWSLVYHDNALQK